MCELPIFHVYGLHLVLYEHGDVEEHVVQLRDGLLQVDEHLVPVLDVADRLPELVLVAFDLEKNMSGLLRGAHSTMESILASHPAALSSILRVPVNNSMLQRFIDSPA